MHQQLWGYKVVEKLYLGVLEQKSLNTAALDDTSTEIDINCIQPVLITLQSPQADNNITRTCYFNKLY
jgi:hypothetical protein